MGQNPDIDPLGVESVFTFSTLLPLLSPTLLNSQICCCPSLINLQRLVGKMGNINLILLDKDSNPIALCEQVRVKLHSEYNILGVSWATLERR
jgi:hypothetical protein